MEFEIDELTIKVKSIFNEDRSKRYLRTYSFPEVEEGAVCAVIVYSPRMSDAFLSGTTTQMAYSLVRKHMGQPIKELRVISLVPTLAMNIDLPYVESSLDKENYRFVEETLNLVHETGGITVVGWGSPGRLMHHGTPYKQLFAAYEQEMFCIGLTNKGEPKQIRMAHEETALEPFVNESVKPKFRILTETKDGDVT